MLSLCLSLYPLPSFLFFHRLSPIITCSPSPSLLEETQWVIQHTLSVCLSLSLSKLKFHSDFSAFLSSCVSFLPVLRHCLFLWISLTPLLPHWFTVLLFQASSCHFLSFLFQFTVCFCHVLKSAGLALSLLLLFFSTFLSKPVFHLPSPAFYQSPPTPSAPPNCLTPSPSGYGWVRSICGQRPSQPERWAKWFFSLGKPSLK